MINPYYDHIYSFLHYKSVLEISHKIDEDVHDSTKVSDDSCWREEKTVGHYLQVELNAHKDHKHVFPNLKHMKYVEVSV